MAELDALVQKMESGNLPLEESLATYKRGAELIQICRAKLADAEQQVKVLEGDVLKPFATDQGEPS